jgi:hypothetical protein
MKFAIAVMTLTVLLVLLLPGLAAADDTPTLEQEIQMEEMRRLSMSVHPSECAQLRRRIDHFTMMEQRARILENEQWQSKMGTHVGRLREIQKARCPKDVPIDTVGMAIMHFLKLGSKAALTYFTFGAAGF